MRKGGREVEGMKGREVERMRVRLRGGQLRTQDEKGR